MTPHRPVWRHPPLARGGVTSLIAKIGV